VRSPRNASYVIAAKLDATNHLILGSGRLTWRNISKNPTSGPSFFSGTCRPAHGKSRFFCV